MFDRIFASLVAQAGVPKRLMIDGTFLKADRTAASLAQKGGSARCIGRTKSGLNSKLHAVCDGQRRLLLTAGQTSDHLGAAALLGELPTARELIADRGYDSAALRRASRTWHRALHPFARSGKIPMPYDRALYRDHHNSHLRADVDSPEPSISTLVLPRCGDQGALLPLRLKLFRVSD